MDRNQDGPFVSNINFSLRSSCSTPLAATSTNTNNSQSQSYQCPHCEMVYINWSALAMHTLSHQLRAFGCRLCNASFSSAQDLQMHIELIHQLEPQNSDAASLTLKDILLQGRPNSLAMAEHRSDRRYCCVHKSCKMAFVTDIELTVHARCCMMKHRVDLLSSGGDIPSSARVQTSSTEAAVSRVNANNNMTVKCPYCSQSYSNKYNLKTHIKLKHSNTSLPIRQHKCVYCSKKFASAYDLGLHTRTHTGERPYACEICNATYTRQGSLTNHLKSVHTQISSQPMTQISGGGGNAQPPPIPIIKLDMVCQTPGAFETQLPLSKHDILKQCLATTNNIISKL